MSESTKKVTLKPKVVEALGPGRSAQLALSIEHVYMGHLNPSQRFHLRQITEIFCSDYPIEWEDDDP